MIVEGGGEVLTPVKLDLDLFYLIVKPGFGVSTKSFLKKFDNFQDPLGFHQVLEGIETNNYHQIVDHTHNDFQRLCH
ncbi:hypothetical protein MGH68_00810 [Erysipelothrix sp. D19-032]